MHSVFKRMARIFYVLHPVCIRNCSGTGPLGNGLTQLKGFEMNLRTKNTIIPSYRHDTEAQRKKSENGSRIWGSAILKEVFSIYEELSSGEVIFIHNIPACFLFLTKNLSLIILEFSHLICLNHKTMVNLPKKIGNPPKIGEISCLFLHAAMLSVIIYCTKKSLPVLKLAGTITPDSISLFCKIFADQFFRILFAFHADINTCW